MEWKQKIRETAGKAAHEAQKMAKIAKLNLRILSEEDKIKKAQLELGKLCHCDYVSGAEANTAAYLPWHEKIAAAETQIAVMRAEIDTLKAEDTPVTVDYVEVDVNPSADLTEEAPADCCGGECDCGTDCCCDINGNCGDHCCEGEETQNNDPVW